LKQNRGNTPELLPDAQISKSVKTVIGRIEAYIALWPQEHLTGFCNSHIPLSAPL
jgi:hypothetical protein